MLAIEFAEGTAVNHAAIELARLASQHEESCTWIYEGVAMIAHPNSKPQDVLQKFWEEQERKAQIEALMFASQSVIDGAMQRLENLDFTNLDELVMFFATLTEPSNHFGVTIDGQRIVETFTRHRFYMNCNTGQHFDKQDRENFARYLIGQGLGQLWRFKCIHKSYVQFAQQWRLQFGVL